MARFIHAKNGFLLIQGKTCTSIEITFQEFLATVDASSFFIQSRIVLPLYNHPKLRFSVTTFLNFCMFKIVLSFHCKGNLQQFTKMSHTSMVKYFIPDQQIGVCKSQRSYINTLKYPKLVISIAFSHSFPQKRKRRERTKLILDVDLLTEHLSDPPIDSLPLAMPPSIVKKYQK